MRCWVGRLFESGKFIISHRSLDGRSLVVIKIYQFAHCWLRRTHAETTRRPCLLPWRKRGPLLEVWDRGPRWWISVTRAVRKWLSCSICSTLAIDGRIKETLGSSCCNIANKDAENSSWISLDDLGVEFQICLAAIANEDEPSFGKVREDTIQCALLAFSYGLKDALKHTGVMLEMEGALGKAGSIEEAPEHWVKLPRHVGDIMKLDAHVRHLLVPFLDPVDTEITKVTDKDVPEDFSCASTNCRMLDGVIDITDQTDTIGFRNMYCLSGRQLVRGKNTDTSGYEVQSSAKIEMTSIIGIDCT